MSLVKLGFGVTGNNASAGGYKIDQSWQLDLKLGITEGTMPSEFTRHELFLHKYLMEKDFTLFRHTSDDRAMFPTNPFHTIRLQADVKHMLVISTTPMVHKACV